MSAQRPGPSAEADGKWCLNWSEERFFGWRLKFAVGFSRRFRSLDPGSGEVWVVTNYAQQGNRCMRPAGV